MVVKILIASVGLLAYFISVLIPSSWYCGELMSMGTLESIIFSLCFINNILYAILITGLLLMLDLKKLNSRNILILLVAIVLIGVGVHHINAHGLEYSINIQLSEILQLLKSYIGSFLGILIGIWFFNKKDNIKRGLLYLVFIWLTLNVGYPILK